MLDRLPRRAPSLISNPGWPKEDGGIIGGIYKLGFKKSSQLRAVTALIRILFAHQLLGAS